MLLQNSILRALENFKSHVERNESDPFRTAQYVVYVLLYATECILNVIK